MRIAVDVMGGDYGSRVVIVGVRRALAADGQIEKLWLVGNQAEIENGCRHANLRDPRVEIVHASEMLTMKDRPAEVRTRKDSSMVRALELVRDNKADAVISPGNTGALVAGSLRLRRLDGIERPALAARMPSKTRDFVLLDAGANPVCEPLHLAQFAVMGSIYSREVLGRDKPRVGILSNGSEDSKGNELTKGAVKLCASLDLNFMGYVEGFELFKDGVDVAIADGFTGNIVLKTAESLGYAMMQMLRRELTATPVRKLGAQLSRGAFLSLKQRIDPEVYGGAALLGFNGIVIKAHGSARENAIMNAIRLATDEIRHNVNQLIVREIARANARMGSSGAHAAKTAKA